MTGDALFNLGAAVAFLLLAAAALTIEVRHRAKWTAMTLLVVILLAAYVGVSGAVSQAELWPEDLVQVRVMLQAGVRSTMTLIMIGYVVFRLRHRTW